MTSRVPITSVLIVLSVFAGLTGIRLAYTLAYLMLAILVVSFIWSRGVARSVRVRRRSPNGVYTVGDLFEEEFTVTNTSFLALPYCEVHDRSDVSAYSPDRVCALGGRRSVAWRASGAFDRRGRHRFGPLVARVGDPFGLFPRTIDVAPVNEVIVFPAIHHVDGSLVGAAGGGFETTPTGHSVDRAPDVAGVRDYEFGDSLNRIHWPSTARTGALKSRVYDTQLSSDQLILLDLQSGLHLGSPPESSLEYAVSLCASIAHAALRSGRAVGLITNDRDGTAIAASRGETQRLRLLEYLALATDNGTASLTDVIVQHARAWRGRGGLTVITTNRDTSWVDALFDVGARGQRHLAVFIDSTTFGAAGTPFRVAASWRLAVNWWVVHRGDIVDGSTVRVVGL